MLLTFRYRVKSLTGPLNRQSRAVNFVWNFCNDSQKHALKWGKKWPSGFDLNVLTTGSSKELGLHSGTVNAVCEQYAHCRRQHRRPYLRYRGKKSLSWVPLKERDLKCRGNAFRFSGHTFRVFNSRTLPEGKIRDGKPSSRIVREFDHIAVGNVTAARLARTSMAKSVLDAGWSSFRQMLAYKAIKHGARYTEVEERFSTQVCSACGAMPPSRPKGIADLGVRSWTCSECQVTHDRDVNAALNLLARSGFGSGHRTPAEGISAL